MVSKKYLLLNRYTVMKCLLWFGFLTTLLIAHLWLGFKIRDYKIQTQILQHYELRIKDYNKGLKSEINKLEKDWRVREFARTQLNMMDTEPSELEYMTIPTSLLAKYKSIDTGVSVALPTFIDTAEDEDKGIVEKTLDKLMRTSVAEEPRDK